MAFCRKENKARANPKHWSPVFAGVGGSEPLWRRFWAVMIAAAALRLLAAVSGDWLIRTDELFPRFTSPEVKRIITDKPLQRFV